MNTKSFRFVGANAVMLQGVIWTPICKPCMVVQIVHGMTEHIGRYEKLASILTGSGIAVVGFDLRGHGQNKGNHVCASFGKKGWRASLHDIFLFHLEMNRLFPNIPYFMMGFSLGSFLVRDYLSRYNDKVAGAIIMGTGYQRSMVLSILKAVVRMETRKYGFNHSTPLVRKLSFETYNQRFAPNKTPYDWLCSDEAELHAYMGDPLCCRNISAGLFWQLLDAMKRTGNVCTYKHWHRETPVLLLSGTKDPVGDFGKGVQRVMRSMAKGGIKNVRMHLIPNARHDLLHEKRSGAAYEAIEILTNWLFEKI